MLLNLLVNNKKNLQKRGSARPHGISTLIAGFRNKKPKFFKLILLELVQIGRLLRWEKVSNMPKIS